MAVRSVFLWLFVVSGALVVGLAAGPASAVAESEPNDAPENGTPLTVGASSGSIGGGDEDYWVFNATADGWGQIEFTLASGLSLSLGSEVGPPATLGTQSTSVKTFQLIAGKVTWVLVGSSTGSTGSYMFNFATAGNASEFSEGTGETEPNNDEAHATVLAADDSYDAMVDEGVDTTDFFRFVGHRGDAVSIWVARATGETGSISIYKVSGFPGSPGASTGDLSVLLTADADLVFKVTTNAWAVNYTIDTSLDHTPAYADGKMTLGEAYSDTVVKAYIHPKTTPAGIPATGVTLSAGSSSGMGYMYGETMCVESALGIDVPNVTIEAGLRLDPMEKTLQTMVVSKTVTVTIPADGKVCFDAISYNESGDLGYSYEPYKPGVKLSGDAMAVMRVIDNRSTDGAAEQLALWAVTSGTTESRAGDWRATSATIADAKTILNDAGVHTQLNPTVAPPAPPTGGTTGGTGGTGSTNTGSGSPLAIVGGVIFALILVAGIAGAVASKRRRQAAAAMPLAGQPFGQPFGQRPANVPGGPVYPQQYGAPPGVPASPWAAPPAPYYPPQRPVYAQAPARPYQPFVPVPPYVPTAPPPPAAPAAPREATVPCPTCGSALAYYAPKCPKCGMEMSWT